MNLTLASLPPNTLKANICPGFRVLVRSSACSFVHPGGRRADVIVFAGV